MNKTKIEWCDKTLKDVFRFRPQKMSYELMYRQTFAEILCPDTMYDLIDYHLRECLKREIKMRRCKNCGRLFAVTGHGGTEYCDRPADGKGRTCKEIGAFRVWEKSKRSVSFLKRQSWRGLCRCRKFNTGA